MTTYGEIITAGHGYSSKSRPDKIATQATELLALASRAVRGIYAVAARINPEYFGQSVAQPYVAGATLGWPRPVNAQTVFRIELAGAEVAVVPLSDQKAEQAKPSVYHIGKVYKIAGSALGPTVADTLTIFSSKLPAKPTVLADVIDATWEEAFDNFGALEIAIYLALKDGRLDELQTLLPDRAKEAQLFIDFLTFATPITTYRFAQPRMVALPSLMPLLAGGKDA
ncbi:MAG: hypothetical protein ABJA80_03995 [bacterium]